MGGAFYVQEPSILMPYLRPATIEDAYALSKNLRAEDQAEVQAMTGEAPLDALLHGVKMSDLPVSIVDEDGSILGMYGAVTTLDSPRTGTVWMLASPEILKYRRQFARESRQWIEALQNHYDILFNLVDERNTVHIRWLQWCGFTFIRRHPEFGVENRPFTEFVRIRSHV
jgi:hypothetical protein